MDEETAVILVEDDDAHAALVEGYVRAAGHTGHVQRYIDGEAAIRGLEETVVECTRSLMFLDIRLPLMDGLDVLRWMKASPERRTIPVIMLTTSSSIDEVQTAYRLGANGYLLKRLDPVAFFEMIEATLKYWFRWNRMR